MQQDVIISIFCEINDNSSTLLVDKQRGLYYVDLWEYYENVSIYRKFKKVLYRLRKVLYTKCTCRVGFRKEADLGALFYAC